MKSQEVIFASAPRVLIIEERAETMAVLVRALAKAGFYTHGVTSFPTLDENRNSKPYDLVNVSAQAVPSDYAGPDQSLRIDGKLTPTVLVEVANGVQADNVALETRNVLRWPLNDLKIVEVARSLLVKNSDRAASTISIGDAQLDLESKTLLRGASLYELANKEVTLLSCLMQAQGGFMTKKELLERVWKYDFEPHTNIVDVLICRLRQKIDPGHERSFIRTIRGVGYAVHVHPASAG